MTHFSERYTNTLFKEIIHDFCNFTGERKQSLELFNFVTSVARCDDFSPNGLHFIRFVLNYITQKMLFDIIGILAILFTTDLSRN